MVVSGLSGNGTNIFFYQLWLYIMLVRFLYCVKSRNRDDTPGVFRTYFGELCTHVH